MEKKETILERLYRLGGLYRALRDGSGNFLSPLVGLSGRYEDKDGTLRQFVSDEYANFAVLESHGIEVFDVVLHELLPAIQDRLGLNSFRDVYFCGVPEGGKTFAAVLAASVGGRFVYPEKKIIRPVTETSREVTKFVFGRHEIEPGSKVIMIEDVTTSFSSSAELAAEIVESERASVLLLATLLDRSNSEDLINSKTLCGKGKLGYGLLDVLYLQREPMSRWRLDELESGVAHAVSKGSVEWNPKKNWQRLMAEQKQACEWLLHIAAKCNS